MMGFSVDWVHLFVWVVLSPCVMPAEMFERAIRTEPVWEKGYFCFAKYLDQLMRAAKLRQQAGAKTGSSELDRLGGRSR